MAAPQENLLSLGQLTGTERNTFTKQRGHCGQNSVNRPVLLQDNFSTLQSHKHLRVLHLQQSWQELKERELAAQQHNRELLQQFEKAQDTVRVMLARNAAMKTIRMEYEQYLEESYPCWQQQLKEKTQAALALRMGECLRSHLNNTEGVTKFSAHPHLHSQGPTKKPQKVAANQEYNSQNTHSDNNQDGFSHLPYMQSSWLTHPQSQTVRLPIRVPYQPQASSHLPPSYLPHPFQLHHLASMTGHHHPWPRQDAPSWSSLQTARPWSLTTGATGLPSGSEALWGQLYTEDPPPESRVSQVVAQEVETSRAPSTKSGRGGGSRSSHLSQELDVKPVRLSSDHAESSESGRNSSQVIREKRKKREMRGRSQRTSSEKERHSQESSMTPTAFVIASVAVQSSGSDTISEKCSTGRIKRTRRSGGQATESQDMEKMAKERTRSKEDESVSQNEESECLSEEPKTENAGNQSADNKSENGREVSRGNTIQPENGGRDEIQKQDDSSCEQSSADEKKEEKGHEKHLEGEDGAEDNAEEKENSQADEELEEGDAEEEDDNEEKENSQADEELEEGDNEEVEEGNNAEEKENSQADEELEEGDTEEEDDNEEKENSLSEEEQEEKEEEEDKNVSIRKNTSMEEGTGAEDEVVEECVDKDKMKNENCESSASSQDEVVDEEEIEQGKDKTEDEEGSDEEEDGEGEDEKRRDKAGKPEEESDSEHSIILSPENRYTKMHFIPEEVAEDEIEKRGSKTGSSEEDDSNDFSEDDIENLLAPQEQRKEEKDLKATEKPKAICDSVKTFQVEEDRPRKTDDQSDSDEFDHFYD